jgi:hypothetical protein
MEPKIPKKSNHVLEKVRIVFFHYSLIVLKYLAELSKLRVEWHSSVAYVVKQTTTWLARFRSTWTLVKKPNSGKLERQLVKQYTSPPQHPHCLLQFKASLFYIGKFGDIIV